MNKFKIGDKVRLRKDVVVGNCYNNTLLSSLIYEDFENLCLKIEDKSDNEQVPFVVSKSGKGWYVGEDALELYQEECSYKKGDTFTIGSYKGSIDKDSVGYYLNFGPTLPEHREVCNRLKELFGTNVFISTACKCNCISSSGAFPDFKSIEDLVTFVNELNKLLIDSNKESDSITIKKDQNNEIRFQKPKASSKRGVVPAGSTISGRKDKIAISIGHLSYQVCNC